MDEVASGIWWVLVLQSLCALLFGMVGLLSPAVILLWLLVLFAAYALLAGAVAIVGAALIAGVVKSRTREGDLWLLLLLGLAGSEASVFAAVHPHLTALVLALLMGANAVVSGLLQIAMAIRLRRVVSGQRLPVAAGIVSVAFGVVVLLHPGAGAAALLWLVGCCTVASGALLIAVAFRLKSWARARRERAASAEPYLTRRTI